MARQGQRAEPCKTTQRPQAVPPHCPPSTSQLIWGQGSGEASQTTPALPKLTARAGPEGQKVGPVFFATCEKSSGPGARAPLLAREVPAPALQPTGPGRGTGLFRPNKELSLGKGPLAGSGATNRHFLKAVDNLSIRI